ncbi:hypothetical protein GTR04_6668 [Trichophyton interdigitale]|nr:hypothetical protein GY631_7315 [Trichophyton interdigitale]KAG5217430.1 hypothetical protein GY632_6562 [Trichophyton interdigitale]KAG8205956.1 hypothetical protein GTR04_6668 [Trichophyton interdigitale]
MDRLPDELLMHIIYQAIDMRGSATGPILPASLEDCRPLLQRPKTGGFWFYPVTIYSEPIDGRQYVGFYDSSGDEESHPESTKFTRAIIYTLFEALGRGDANAQPPPALKLGRDSIASSGIYPITIERFLRIVPLDDHQKTLPILRCVESF